MIMRRALTLIEALVVILIIAILLGLLLPAVQRIRDVAIRTRSLNNVRQIALAVQHYGSSHGDRLPVLDGSVGSPNHPRSVYVAILPLIEQGALYDRLFNSPSSAAPGWLYIPQYVSPADPSVDQRTRDQYASYALNALAFQPGSSLTASFPDGLSNTICTAEHYARCGNNYVWAQHSTMNPGNRRATFADGGHCPRLNGLCYADVTPVTSGNPPVSGPNFVPVGPRHPDDPLDLEMKPITTPFQAAPSLEDCHYMIPQTPHRSGMITSLMDGSVRIIAPTITQATFWGAVTPDRGEILADW